MSFARQSLRQLHITIHSRGGGGASPRSSCRGGALTFLPPTAGAIRKFVVAALLLVVMGCSNADKKLVGKWQHERLAETIEFFDDKTGIFDVKDKPSLAFRWSLPDEHHVKLEFKIANETKPLIGTIDKNTIVLKGDSRQETYKKIK